MDFTHTFFLFLTDWLDIWWQMRGPWKCQMKAHRKKSEVEVKISHPQHVILESSWAEGLEMNDREKQSENKTLKASQVLEEEGKWRREEGHSEP